MVKRILRPSLIHNSPGRPGSLPVGKTSFWKDYIHRPDEPGPNIPGTNVERLTLIPLGDKSVGVLEDDVDRVIVQLAASRPDSQKRLARRAATKAGQERAREQRAKQRNQRLFDWADAALKKLGIDKAVAAASSIEELRRVTFDANSAEIIVAIRDALHPASGHRQEHFRGLQDGSLKLILKNRFTELKKSPEATLRRQKPKQPHWTDQLIVNKDGKIIANLANLIGILREAPKWRGVLAFDEFSARVVIRKRPPWGEEEAADAPWTDHHESLARSWFQREKINAAAGDIGRAVQAAARHNPFHPVRAYFDALVWDGVPRLDTWLVTYFHAEDGKYVRAIGARYLISGVARIYWPGCKVDHVLGLEGPQGKQKSEALRTLAIDDSWFTDRWSHVASKDAALEIAGVLIVEIAEMDALTRATSSAIKAFLTRRRDRFRPPYGKHTVNLPRQCVFAVTINPPVGGYLKDPTGARRFWPVACRGMIDRDGLEQVRDQLWAEAVHRFKAGAPWWLETPELEALATAEQAMRFVVDAWEEPVREWVGDRVDVGLFEVLEHALGFVRERQTQLAQKRIVAILGRMGLEKRRSRTPEGRENRYQRDPPPAKR
jgi:predicted P-loop ATPase